MQVMGILNVTPDSFACHCKTCEPHDILAAYNQLIAEGADIVDVGACSTKPQGKIVDEQEEQRRLQIALSTIREAYPTAYLSVDTFRASIAQWVIAQYGVQIINDVSGLADPDMMSVVARARVPYVLTHSRNIQEMSEMVAWFAFQLDKLHQAGVSDIIIDPGFGFGKTQATNYYILRHLQQLNVLGAPILVGISRKSMIYQALETTPTDALNGTIVAHTLALLQGADILRVHDVRAARETIQIVQTYQTAK